MKWFYNLFSEGVNDLLLVGGMVGVLFILFAPIPAALLDFFLVLNFALALLILLITFYSDKPREFSTFPSLLLMATLFRLALNISATRLILGDADAGKVINAVGEHVVGGNYIIGLVIFLILIVVQYVVVTSGAQRVAEVAARFTLDSMPGKQMSIDADLNMGIIDHEEAKLRRAAIEKESNFYGAMDGASKFVKGDAIAGIVIILIDIIGGLTIGMAQRGMDWGDALQHYALLTVGDGIVTQIPALIISVATGIIITRAATDSRLASEIGNQFLLYPKVFVIVGITMFAFILLPNMPFLPILVVMIIMAIAVYISSRKSTSDDVNHKNQREVESDTSVTDEMKVIPFELSLGKTLSDAYLTATAELESRVALVRKKIASQFGFQLPTLTMRYDSELEGDSYRISIHGMSIGDGSLKPDSLLAINPGNAKVELEGVSTKEPTYGLKAKWIDVQIRAQAKAAGYTLVEPDTVLVTHIQELCKRHAARFLTRAETERVVEKQRDLVGSLIDELIPGLLTYSDVQHVLQTLLEEQVSIKNIEIILEVLVDKGRQIKEPERLVEQVREKLGPVICNEFIDADGKLNIMTLAPDLERKLMSKVVDSKGGDTRSSIMKPQEMELFLARVAKESEKVLNRNLQAVLLCAPAIRRELKKLLARTVPYLNVISINEITSVNEVSSTAVINIDSGIKRSQTHE